MFFLLKVLKEKNWTDWVIGKLSLDRGEIAPWLSDILKEVHRMHNIQHVEGC